MVKKKVMVCAGVLMLFVVVAMNAEGRSQYKKIVVTMDAKTPAETGLQAHVVAHKCKICHVPKTKNKERTTFGQALHDALGGGDKENYKFDKKAWKKDKATKTYPPESVQKLRDAINAVEVEPVPPADPVPPAK